MDFFQSIKIISVETILSALSAFLIIGELFLPYSVKRKLTDFTLLILGLTLAWIPFIWNLNGNLFDGAFQLSPFTLFFKMLFIGSGALVIYMGREFLEISKIRAGEFNILSVLAILGACLLVSSGSLITAFISIELMTIALYVLTGYLKADERSLEAASKYLIMGAFSSAVMLYGVSLIYGTCGSFSFTAIRESLNSFSQIPVIFYAGFILLLAGIGFKISLFPFQLWVPDVYEGAPTPVTAFLSVISKAAGFSFLIRFLSIVDKTNEVWIPLLALLSLATIFYGNLGALPQLNGNLKRLLGYSSIAHAGYLLMGLSAHSIVGTRAVLYYLVVYGIANLTIFLGLVASGSKDNSILSLRGLFKKSPVITIAMFTALLSLAGIPPLGGFFAKFLLLQAVIEQGMIWLAVLGALNIVVSLYYYLSVTKVIFVDPSYEKNGLETSPSAALTITISLLAVSLVLFGIFQLPLLHVISKATAI